MTTLPSLPSVNLSGPFWTAKAEILELADPIQNWAFRVLFLDQTPRAALGNNNLLLPGTMLVLCWVKQVEISPAQEKYIWKQAEGAVAPKCSTLSEIEVLLQSGELALLLVQTDSDPTKWRSGTQDSLPELTCLAGDISLRVMTSPVVGALYRAVGLTQIADNPTDREGSAKLFSAVTVHSSGVSLLGSCTLPWESQPRKGVFQLAKVFPEQTQPEFRLTVERERLTSDETSSFITAWKNLSDYLTPNRADASVHAPIWVTLEVANLENIPGIYWKIIPWQASPTLPLLCDQDEFNLLFSDRSPYNKDNPPTSLARVTTEVRIERNGSNLKVSLAKGTANSRSILEYVSTPAGEDQPWNESFQLPELQVAFSSVQTPRFLRDSQNIATPDWIPLPSPLKLESPPDLASLDRENGTPSDALKQFLKEKISSLSDTLKVDMVWKGNCWKLSDEENGAEYFLRKEANQLEVYTGEPPNPIEPDLLWGFMPLENGWAQLPVPNLTEQIYLDSDLALTPPTTQNSNSEATDNVFVQGVVAWSNSTQASPNEQPWNLTLTGLQSLRGEWLLKFQNNKYQLIAVNIQATAPVVTLNGFFWLSASRPTLADALPNFDNWLTGLQSIPLKTVQPKVDLFPPLMIVTLTDLKFTPRISKPDNSKEVVDAALGSWSMQYQLNDILFQRMVSKKVLPLTTFKLEPLLWCRHPWLPMIQAMPLTQNQIPPNAPSASRQFIPLELPVVQQAEIYLPGDWHFGVNNDQGAASWCQFLGLATPNRGWSQLSDLPLVALSIPGVVLSPLNGNANLNTGLPLGLSYRFDLPYTDEFNALAQLPKIPRDPNTVSPLPDSPPPSPPQPLTRYTLASYWQRLNEQAVLASADAIAALPPQTLTTNVDFQTTINNLVEPFTWPVKLDTGLEQYPGTLTLKNVDGSGSLSLNAESALKGISGRFAQNAGSLARLDNGANGNSFQIVAGSMVARQETDGSVRDQRGLHRSASSKASNLLKTPVRLEKENPPGAFDEYELTSALNSIQLVTKGGDNWQFWFRDLPAKDKVFELRKIRSPKAEDVNDPEALGRNYNFLQGYEWRLFTQPPTSNQPLSLYNLDFYPLTLEKVEFDAEQVKQVEIIGRLQLPLKDRQELEQINSAVRLTFSLSGTNLTLQRIELEPLFGNKPGIGTWFLSAQTNETSEAPRLTWQGIELTKIDQNQPALKITQISLKFTLFGVAWSIPMKTALVFSLSSGNPLEEKIEYPPTPNIESYFTPQILTLNLDLNSGHFNHTLDLDLSIRLSKDTRATFTTNLKLRLLVDSSNNPNSSIEITSLKLFEDLDLDILNEKTVFTDNALQFHWQDYTLSGEKSIPQLLPGMFLKSQSAPGYAALTFKVELKPPSTIPYFTLETAVVEALLSCSWGKSLQAEQTADMLVTPIQTFGSSWGDLVAGYTSEYAKPSWKQSLLLNGILGVTNLISWDSTNPNEPTLPAARLVPPPPLNHLRHTLRVLLNQCEVPQDSMVLSQGELLFTVNQPWKFLSVVEHQLAHIDLTDLTNIRIVADTRWTAVQEIRLLTPKCFQQFLEDLGDRRTLDPTDGIDTLGKASAGNLADGIRNLLITDLKKNEAQLNEILVVEASVHLWVRKKAIPAAQHNNFTISAQRSSIRQSQYASGLCSK